LFRLVQEAHEVLSDPERRRAYDSSRASGGRPSVPREKSAEELRAEELGRARSAYVYFSATCNEATVRAWRSSGSTGPTFAELPAFYAARAEADRQFAREVAGFDWPASVRTAAEALVRATAAEAGLLFQGSMLPGTRNELSALSQRIDAAEDAAVEAAGAMRYALGLPREG